ncbi:porin family protein [Sinimarinibacterium sp. CAU 1509]|uniref:outer membrane beta-barrel protein n=1 Tax=Sinimarinibacterium sp. CAU 1509 TaxID=2562283 RepID=UPI0010AD9229|nr:outer membrane beta-barrel protein [Sinimarinibacterium sp. CAU 1509]TJY59885.1 porin family protein [Sinimarinibacterium sp. CAU 1509]
MRTIKSLVGASILALTPALASAGGVAVDAYYVAVADLEVDGNAYDSGDGFGGRAQMQFSDLGFITAEYQANDYSSLEGTSIDGELTAIRAGLGFDLGANNPFYVRGEYVDFKFESSPTILNADRDDSGYGIHVGAAGALSEALGVYAEIGYIDIGDFGDGMEYMVGALLTVSGGSGIFVDYRYSSLTGDRDIDQKLGDIRTGVRIAF